MQNLEITKKQLIIKCYIKMSEEVNYYYQNLRTEILELIPEGPNSVLDVGCGAGYTLIKLKTLKKAAEVTGIDIVNLNQNNYLDKFIMCNLDNEIPSLPENYYDVIICADILEHLKNPFNVLKTFVKFLSKTGIFIISLPNFREIATLFSIIIKGRFKYTNSGICDITHLRFFCKKDMIDLIKNSGLTISKIKYYLKYKRALFDKLTCGIFSEFLVKQYIFIAKKSS